MSIQLYKIGRESGNQVKQWVFEGYIGPKAREKSGFALSGSVSGYYNLNDRKGWLRFERA